MTTFDRIESFIGNMPTRRACLPSFRDAASCSGSESRALHEASRHGAMKNSVSTRMHTSPADELRAAPELRNEVCAVPPGTFVRLPSLYNVGHFVDLADHLRNERTGRERRTPLPPRAHGPLLQPGAEPHQVARARPEHRTPQATAERETHHARRGAEVRAEMKNKPRIVPVCTVRNPGAASALSVFREPRGKSCSHPNRRIPPHGWTEYPRFQLLSIIAVSPPNDWNM